MAYGYNNKGDKSSLMARHKGLKLLKTGALVHKGLLEVPEEEYVYSGHNACPGCGAAQAMRFVLKALGGNTITVLAASCWSGIAGTFPQSSLKVSVLHTAFETAAAAASGVRASLDMQGNKDTIVLAWAGDGGTFDIGLQALSGAGERNENILFVCYDNEAYMNTGAHRSSATPLLAWTATTPINHPQDRPKKDIMAIMAAHRIPYAATASVAFPHDLMEKVGKAKEIKGTRFLHIYSHCTTGWRYSPELGIKIARLAVESKAFPLYEVFQGERYILTYKPKGVPVQEYLRMQGRFDHLKEGEIGFIQEEVDKRWEQLLQKCATSNTGIFLA